MVIKDILQEYTLKKVAMSWILAKLNRNVIMPGTIIRCNYKGEYSTDPQPVIFVLNGNYKGKLHGIALNVTPKSVLSKLIERVKLNTRLVPTTVYMAGNLVNIRKHEINNPERFYYSFLRSILSSVSSKTPYRTYFVNKMRNIEYYDYRFSNVD